MFRLKISSESKLFGGGPPCPRTTSATLIWFVCKFCSWSIVRKVTCLNNSSELLSKDAEIKRSLTQWVGSPGQLKRKSFTLPLSLAFSGSLLDSIWLTLALSDSFWLNFFSSFWLMKSLLGPQGPYPRFNRHKLGRFCARLNSMQNQLCFVGDPFTWNVWLTLKLWP